MQYNAQSQAVNVAAYPQLCGSWPGDEWPKDDLIEQRGDFVELCGGLSLEHKQIVGAENGKLSRIYGRVE